MIYLQRYEPCLSEDGLMADAEPRKDGSYVLFSDCETEIKRLNDAWKKVVDIHGLTVKALREHLRLAKGEK